MSKWAWVSYESPSVIIVLPGSFNRSAFDNPHESKVSDDGVAQAFAYLNGTYFIAYDERFFDIIRPDAKLAKSPPDPNVHTVFIPDTGVSEFKPVSLKNPYGNRALFAYDTCQGGVLANARFLNNPISYFYDDVRASKNGCPFTGVGDGVDVIDPLSGLTFGTIRVGGGENFDVSVAFGEHEMWIVGRGGV